MAKKNNQSSLNNRISYCLNSFSKESTAVRNELVKLLPAYNVLLSFHALTFEELALLPLARERGLDYTDVLFDYSQVMPPCPVCGNFKRVSRKKENSYFCYECNKKFPANRQSISSDTKRSSTTWMQVLMCMLEHYTVKRTCEHCNISINTYYNIRNKLFYAMQIFLDKIRLSGVVECDNTFIHTNYKGSSLNPSDYPEDSAFNNLFFVPRASRKRGGAYKNSQKNANHVCVFTAIDEHDRVAVRYVGLGNATATKLLRAMPASKYAIDNNLKLVSDREQAIIKYASMLGVDLEDHVYRSNNRQMKLSDESNDIQRVNALHRRLKEFFRKCNYVSSKYLPGFLVFFEFIENTGATTEAMRELFEILAKPGFGQPPTFYESSYVAPNYYLDWKDDNSVFKKFLTTNYWLHISIKRK